MSLPAQPGWTRHFTAITFSVFLVCAAVLIVMCSEARKAAGYGSRTRAAMFVHDVGAKTLIFWLGTRIW